MQISSGFQSPETVKEFARGGSKDTLPIKVRSDRLTFMMRCYK